MKSFIHPPTCLESTTNNRRRSIYLSRIYPKFTKLIGTIVRLWIIRWTNAV